MADKLHPLERLAAEIDREKGEKNRSAVVDHEGDDKRDGQHHDFDQEPHRQNGQRTPRDPKVLGPSGREHDTQPQYSEKRLDKKHPGESNR